MAFSYPLDLPVNPTISAFDIRQNSVVAVSTSPYTGDQQVYAYPGQWWKGDVTLPPLTRDQVADWRAFFAKLNGREGVFLMGDPTWDVPRGEAANNLGTPRVNGSGQVGNTLVIDGCPASVTNYLRAGDYIQLGNGLNTRLHRVLTDVDSDGGGNATIDLWPSHRSSPADNSQVVVNNCKGLFRLDTNDPGDSIQPGPFYNISFPVREAL